MSFFIFHFEIWILIFMNDLFTLLSSTIKDNAKGLKNGGMMMVSFGANELGLMVPKKEWKLGITIMANLKFNTLGTGDNVTDLEIGISSMVNLNFSIIGMMDYYMVKNSVGIQLVNSNYIEIGELV